MASLSEDGRLLFFDASNRRKTMRLTRYSREVQKEIEKHVEKIVERQVSGEILPRATAVWISEIPDKLRKKLEDAGLISLPEGAERVAALPATLGPFLDAYIANRKATGSAERSLINYAHARSSLVSYFGANRKLAEITEADAADWRRWMQSDPAARKIGGKKKPLMANTTNRRCGFARQFFAYAVDKRLIAENPFRKLKGVAVKANKSRDYYVTTEETEAVLAAIPNVKWRLIFALARYGGLRCPCEYKPLFWADVRWAEDRIRINSPKTGERFIPIFAELRPYLEAALLDAGAVAVDDPAGTRVVNHPGHMSWNFATDLKRFIELAGVTPWTKPFQNLRLTRQTELAATWPLHVVCAWIGNSETVAKEHYLRATAADFEKAAHGECATSQDGSKVAHKMAQNSPEPNGADVNNDTGENEKRRGTVILPDVFNSSEYTPQESNL